MRSRSWGAGACAGLVLTAGLAGGCGNEDNGAGDDGQSGGDSASGGTPGVGGGGGTGGTAEPPLPGACSDLGMTQYTATDLRWCAFDRTHPTLPDFVREGMTVAIAEPFAGSSYRGEPGEACGECWEISTFDTTELVMVHDLCPIEGNPVCAGSQFHFDLSTETAAALGGELGVAAARQVPCPVTGAIQLRVASRNEYGYAQIAFFNHRLPIRTVELRAADGDTWQPLERCNARWCVEADALRSDASGAVFRLTSADPAVAAVETAVFPATVLDDQVFDTGAQFAEVPVAGGACVPLPAADVYDEAWGASGGTTWEPNPWGATTLTEIGEGCAEDSASCLLLTDFADSGLHVTYASAFPTATFTTLSLAVRAQAGEGTIEIAPRTADARCPNPVTVPVGSTWTTAEVDVATACPDIPAIHGLTVSRPSGPLDLVLDEIRWR